MDLQTAYGSVTESFKTMLQGVSDEMQMCILNCLQCHQVCEVTIDHCLRKGGHHADSVHIQILRDCAQICSVSADFMLRGSDLHMRTCDICAEVCIRCAQDCERMNDDSIMQNCIDVCRRCSESCKKMAEGQLQ